jgi:hypothetical protein
LPVAVVARGENSPVRVQPDGVVAAGVHCVDIAPNVDSLNGRSVAGGDHGAG